MVGGGPLSSSGIWVLTHVLFYEELISCKIKPMSSNKLEHGRLCAIHAFGHSLKVHCNFWGVAAFLLHAILLVTPYLLEEAVHMGSEPTTYM